MSSKPITSRASESPKEPLTVYSPQLKELQIEVKHLFAEIADAEIRSVGQYRSPPNRLLDSVSGVFLGAAATLAGTAVATGEADTKWTVAIFLVGTVGAFLLGLSFRHRQIQPTLKKFEIKSLGSAPHEESMQSSYDSLDDQQQASVRETWDQEIEESTRALRLDQVFAAQGRSYFELDDTDRVVRRNSASRRAVD